MTDRRGYLRIEIERCEKRIVTMTDPERRMIATSYVNYLRKSLRRKGSGANSLGGIAADLVDKIGGMER